MVATAPLECSADAPSGSCALEGLTTQQRRGLLPVPGDCCHNERGESHFLVGPEDDAELQLVLNALSAQPGLAGQFGAACDAAISYVLDGGRTGRFDLRSPDVDSDERASVGTKLQYHLIEQLGLSKHKHPDTFISGVGVDIKGTVRANHMIPKEGQCRLSLLVKMDAQSYRHEAWLMRTHRAWLHSGKGNNDGKRGIRIRARDRYAVPLYPSAPLAASPLTLLSHEQLSAVFAEGVGQARRLLALFSFLPGTVITRDTILTVCYNRQDPIRRARQVKADAAATGLELLCGTWVADRQRASELGFVLGDGDWVACSAGKTAGPGGPATATAQLPLD